MILNEIYIDTRYPDTFGLLPYGDATKEEALKIFEETTEVFLKLKKCLK